MNEENQEAFKIISQACAVYNGQLSEHQAIQVALEKIKSALTEKGPEEEGKKDA